MQVQVQVQRPSITLKGSSDTVTEFFGYGINTILYQRGIYPPEQFERKQKYGLTMLVTSDETLKAYLRNVLAQLHTWLMQKTIKKVIVVITDVATAATIERWQFDVDCDKSHSESSYIDMENRSAPVQKAEKEIHAEIQGIVRQITASVTFLPVIDSQCTFEVLMYTDQDVEAPPTMQESDPKYVSGAHEVLPLRSFSTKIHTVSAAVSYRDVF